MRLEPLYTVTFTTPEAWSVEAAGGAGICGAVFNLACMPAILTSLPPPVPAWERLYTDSTTNPPTPPPGLLYHG